MKRAMVLTAALLSAAMLLPGQSDGNDQWRTLLTWGVANGRYWNQLLPVQKVHYVQGFMDGVAMAQSIDSAVNAPKSIPYGLTNGEIIKSLDRFFDTPENVQIPISLALFICRQRLDGVAEAEVQKHILGLRAGAGKQ